MLFCLGLICFSVFHLQVSYLTFTHGRLHIKAGYIRASLVFAKSTKCSQLQFLNCLLIKCLIEWGVVTALLIFKSCVLDRLWYSLFKIILHWMIFWCNLSDVWQNQCLPFLGPYLPITLDCWNISFVKLVHKAYTFTVNAGLPPFGSKLPV